MNATKISILIKKNREKMGLTQEELAKKLGYKNKSSIARIENGTANISSKKISEFAKVLNITTTDIFSAIREDMYLQAQAKMELFSSIDKYDQLEFSDFVFENSDTYESEPKIEKSSTAEPIIKKHVDEKIDLNLSDEDIIKTRNYLVHFHKDGRAEMVLQSDIEPKTRHLLKYLESLSEESKLELLKRAEELHLLEEMKKKKEDEEK